MWWIICLCRFVFIYYLDRHQCFILVGFIYFFLNVQIISLWLVHQLWMAVVVIVWLLDLQLHVQSVSITTKVVSLKPAYGEVYWIHYVTVCQWPATGQWFSLGTPVSSTNKTNCNDLTAILLKVAINTINPDIVNYFFRSDIVTDLFELDIFKDIHVIPFLPYVRSDIFTDLFELDIFKDIHVIPFLPYVRSDIVADTLCSSQYYF